LEKKYQFDIGRGKRQLKNEVDYITDICFDASSKKLIVARDLMCTQATNTAIINVNNSVEIARQFQTENGKCINHCFLKNGHLYEMGPDQNGYHIERSDLGQNAKNKDYKIVTGDTLMAVTSTSTGPIVGLFTNRPRELVNLRLFDDEFTEKTTFNTHLEMPNALYPLQDGRLIVRGADGIEIISFKGFTVKQQTTIKLPNPIKKEKTKTLPAVRAP
jgi:hypothetical protein